MDPFDEASAAFVAWLKSSGADVSNKIELKDLRDIEAGRGVVAVQDLEEDELLFRIPRSAILSVENSILSKEIPRATFDHLGPWLSLIFVMLYEYQNQDASNWAPYFRVLPSEFNTLMFWEDDELAELQASAVVQKIGRKSADEMFVKELVPVIKEFADIFFAGDERAKERADEMSQPHNLHLMHKMGSLIMAYAFDVEPANPQKDVDEEGYASEDEDEALPKGMVPMADMLNADADRNNARLFYEEQHLTMKTLTPIKAGEEIFNDYGPLPRSDLLRRYGYITDNYAQYDVVEIPHDLVVSIAAMPGIDTESRIEYLDEQGVIDTGYDISTSSPFDMHDSLSPGLIVLVMTLLMTNTEFNHFKRKEKLPKPEKITLVGINCLLKILKARMQQYPTTLEEDLSTASEATMTGHGTLKERRADMAKSVRVGEKKILQEAQKLLADMVLEMANSNGTSKRQAEEIDSGAGKKQRAR